MKLLVDMNLSPDWVPLLTARGWEVQHWSNIGAGNAPDTELLRWAREHGHVVLTQDLDFSQLLFATQACVRRAGSGGALFNRGSTAHSHR